MTTKSKTTHVTIDLDDVRKAGGVRQALAAWCEEESNLTACGVIGPSFSTSGPGSGWTCECDASDYASRAMHGGALYYLDLDDGRLASSPDWTDDDYHDEPIEWSDASVVRIDCPDVEEAMENIDIVAEMARSVIDYHGAESDRAEWRTLIEAIRRAAEVLEDIDIDHLED